MSDKTIFFSYSRDDSNFVLSLAESLRSAGANVWLDQLDIKPGARWDKSVEEALVRSNILLVILSKSSVDSRNVLDEVSYAFDEEKGVVPVLLEECDIPLRLRRLQYADFTKDHDLGVSTLVAALGLDNETASKLSQSEGEVVDQVIEKSDSNPIIEKAEIDTAVERKSTESEETDKTKEQATLNRSKRLGVIIAILVSILLIGAALTYMFRKSIFKDEESQAWEVVKAKNRIESYEEYISNYEKGKFIKEANDSINSKSDREDKRVDDIAWNTAQNKDSEEGYRTYLNSKNRIKKYTQEAQSKLNSILESESAISMDEEAWNTAESEGDFKSYLAYYKNHEVLGKHKEACIKKLESVGSVGWIYIGRVEGNKFSGEQHAKVSYSKEDYFNESTPKIGDVILSTFREPSRRLYLRPLNRDNNNRTGKSYKSNSEAYVLDLTTEGSKTLILKIVCEG